MSDSCHAARLGIYCVTSVSSVHPMVGTRSRARSMSLRVDVGEASRFACGKPSSTGTQWIKSRCTEGRKGHEDRSGIGFLLRPRFA